MFRELQQEGRKAFGPAVAGLVARLLMDVRMVKADAVGIGLRMKLADLLLRDQRAREDLGQRERRLRADEASRPKSLRELIDSLPVAPALPAPVASTGTGDRSCPV